MINTVILGSTGTGKTQEATALMKMAKVGFVFDYQNSGDWDFLPVYNPDEFQMKCRLTSEMADYREFLRIAKEEYYRIGATIIMEESKLLFEGSNHIDPEVNQFLISCRHELMNFVFMFHGPGQIPPFIMNFTDIVIVKRTDGGEEMLRKKFNEQVYECSLRCKEDMRETWVVGVSNKSIGVLHMNYFNGETLKDKILSGKIAEESKRRIS